MIFFSSLTTMVEVSFPIERCEFGGTSEQPQYIITSEDDHPMFWGSSRLSYELTAIRSPLVSHFIATEILEVSSGKEEVLRGNDCIQSASIKELFNQFAESFGRA
ncbi:hypothetical protein P3S68_002669 [Capsicum galapagoense]